MTYGFLLLSSQRWEVIFFDPVSLFSLKRTLKYINIFFLNEEEIILKQNSEVYCHLLAEAI